MTNRLWHIRLDLEPEASDHEGQRVVREASELHLVGSWQVRASRGFLVEGVLSADVAQQLADTVLRDAVLERAIVIACGPNAAADPDEGWVHVLPKPGVTDPEGETARALLRDLGYAVEQVRTIRSYRIDGPADKLPELIRRVLVHDAVETCVVGPIRFERLGLGGSYRFQRIDVPLRGRSDAELMRISREGQLALSLDEMRAIQAHFDALGRDPTDCELETIAQTWSEHCSHKTLRGLIDFEGERIDNLLKSTIFAATQELGLDWLVSVFADNSGVVRFDEEHDVCFKVETHNHPSAIDPYGGANTGIGGVIRDPLGTGLGAKPICNTDVFCVAPPDTAPESLPPGVLPPRGVLRGVVAGVRDYGNRMGIPTVNGAVVVHPSYLANPLVFCGTVGVMPRGCAEKRVEPGDLIVAIGGRTGRDGIHGATFSSLELTSESDETSGGAVQIGNPIVEKMVLDVVLQARDRRLFRSITDCGAGGFSSAIGEMGAEVGAEVELDRAPLKYAGLSYTEIWISEAQERMVLAVPPESWEAFSALCAAEQVEATCLGRFIDSGRLTLRYQGEVVADLDMEFLHHGRPKVVRRAERPPRPTPAPVVFPERSEYNADLLGLLHDWNVASKEWIIRQYDHEVQARTVIKPLVGECEDGPGDAAVILPVRGSRRGLAIACGIHPRLGEIDAYAMAAHVIDEAIRNCVAVGADPDRIALLDNFCWGNPERASTLGSLVLAARACHDYALAFGTPFISGKDSLYNEFKVNEQSIAIPPTLLISALGQVPDVGRCVTMDLKEPGNLLILLGQTRGELGGSLWLEHLGQASAEVAPVDARSARTLYRVVHQAIAEGLIRACHDLSEGGLAVAVAEMAIAGRLGAHLTLDEGPLPDAVQLFAESPSRLLVEVRPGEVHRLLDWMKEAGVVARPIGRVSDPPERRLRIDGFAGRTRVDLSVDQLQSAWQRPVTDDSAG
ncbi:MAG: phosphoribosylformylglycinamidine synthase subunit PurL [Isosphaeraceae bacterium]|jgi:phosphoribosylformylglycinamidine synthase|nr:MAG: phosphoribosylformylglycinamidine synthase subunit PurL [Isosphaeraceae bacterium]